MNYIEQALAGLAESPPADLERATVVGADAGDLVAKVDSSRGPVWIAWSRTGITGLTPLFVDKTVDEFVDHHRRVAYEADVIPKLLKSEIEEALESGRSMGLSFDLRGLSSFQQSVLRTCATISNGTVRPYGWIAEELHKPGATRAVGTALAKNPIPFLIPCHRVVRSDGSVGSYAFGPEMKKELLLSEGAIAL
ncbi:MAG: methylated-DNA--[protein]-cysteine S-methyltransferase [Acidimicrobiia bacterium]|nr:MAG: methylated-DNA--[protein]-cysteine S-methyltransferase [Acidimicrobiia bacterium]